MLVLGIESSCDETAAAVVKDGRIVLSSVIASQIDVHRMYGGVVPELASRKHLEAIVPVVREAITEAGLDLKEINAVAATRGPGLVGALLVGFSFAKSMAFTLGIPWFGVNHLEGHINSVFLEKDKPEFPFVALLASGGHTSIYYVKSHIEYEILGQTRDDAAGEAYDKVAKMLGLGYPGGKVIDDLAHSGDPKKIKFTRPYLDKKEFDFSFSGIKTAVNLYIKKHEDTYKENIADIAAGFQAAVVDVLTHKILYAALKKRCSHLAIVGGVAANTGLRERVLKEAKTKNLSVHIPSIDLCGDNAAMIAAAGYHYLKKGEHSTIDEDVYSRIRMF